MSRRKITFSENIVDAEAIIRDCQVCHVAMVDEKGLPYVLPFNFGYSNGYIYLHSAQEGKKIDILNNNPNVCITFSTGYDLFHINEDVACSYGMRYKSLVVNGRVEFVTENKDKVDALNIFMGQYVKKDDFTYSAPAVREVCVFRVKLTNFSCKLYGYDKP